MTRLVVPAVPGSTALAHAVSALDGWLDGMRAPEQPGQAGYSGPVMHWWESNLLYTGPGYDWRYEGIIDGYRELYLRTRDPAHLDKAKRAAGDLLPQQLPDGRFRNSSFQFGPVAGGTPHEAALCTALLKLARTLRQHAPHDPLAGTLLAAARRNLEGYWQAQLWNGLGFQDQPYKTVLVANKHATLLEALLELQALTGADHSEYIAACVRVILSAQVGQGAQAGGTVHLGIGPSRLAIPIYTARSMNGLLAAHDAAPTAVTGAALSAAARFISALIRPQGVVWGRYGSGRLALNPLMVAGAGDVLRFLLAMQARGLASLESEIAALTALLLQAQLPSGGLPSAHGFRLKGLSAAAPAPPDLRDVLPVVGWNDKAFRALVLALPPGVVLLPPALRPYQRPVSWRGQPATFQETATHFVMSTHTGRAHYRWTKGRAAPDVYDL